LLLWIMPEARRTSVQAKGKDKNAQNNTTKAEKGKYDFSESKIGIKIRQKSYAGHHCLASLTHAIHSSYCCKAASAGLQMTPMARSRAASAI